MAAFRLTLLRVRLLPKSSLPLGKQKLKHFTTKFLHSGKLDFANNLTLKCQEATGLNPWAASSHWEKQFILVIHMNNSKSPSLFQVPKQGLGIPLAIQR